jgi:large repetitive protein
MRDAHRLCSGLAFVLFVVAADRARGADQTCPDPVPSVPESGVCTVVAGDAGRLLRGTVLLADGVATNASVMIDAAGTITCAGCGCQAVAGADTATRIDCANGVISPGLVDLRNLLGNSQNSPSGDSGERYERRNDWRLGLDGHTQILVAGGATTAQLRWGELRSLMGGVTSMSGTSSTAAALVRNLSSSARLDGLSGAPVTSDNFPLGDAAADSATTTDCGYASLPSVPSDGRFEFVAAEGIDAEARNEFLCLAGLQTGAVDVLTDASVIGAIPLRAADAKVIADHGASVVWQPRNDLRLYGITAPVTLLDAEHVPIALGSVWTPTGSAQLQRELACADSFNGTYLDRHFSDAALWRMVTANAAAAAGFGAEIGTLANGLKADIAVFDGSTRSGYRAVIDAGAVDVVLVLKAGLPMYGEDAVLAALDGGDGVCDPLDVCSSARRLCVQRETGTTLAALSALNAANYPLFFCGAVADEPACTPIRAAGNQAPLFSGDTGAGDRDGDGVADASDDCPAVFDPPRPSDGLVQADADSDGIGDSCDPCPPMISSRLMSTRRCAKVRRCLIRTVPSSRCRRYRSTCTSSPRVATPG